MSVKQNQITKGLQTNTNTMKQQTAVEWLANEILKLDGINDIAIPDNLFDQAKQIHREQIIDAFDEGNPNGFIDKTGEDYYTQTYRQ